MVTAEQIRAARAILQMDQAEAAKISGVSVETIKRLERQTGKLHAKIETIIAIRKAFENQGLEFLGDLDGRGAGVRQSHPDKLQLLRDAMIEEWTHIMDQRLKAECASDPKFFERSAKHLTQTLTKISALILPTVVRSVLSDLQRGSFAGVSIAAQSGAYVPHQRAPTHLSATVESPPSVVGPLLPSIMPANQAAAREISAAERAMADAQYLTAVMLDLIKDASDLNAARNRAFTRAFIAAIPASERGALTNRQGMLSAEGLARTKNAVMARAYGNASVISRITKSNDNEVKSISNGLIMAAPQWAKFLAEIEIGTMRRDLDLTPAIMQAVQNIVDIRARGQKLYDFLAQRDALDNLEDPVDSWMRSFYDTHRKKVANASQIADALRFYVDEAAKVTNDPRLGPDVPGDKIQSNVLHLLRSRCA